MLKDNLRQLNELEAMKQYEIEISDRFVAQEILSDSEDINRVWKNIKENIKILAKYSLGLYDLKQQKPWFHEGRLRFLDQRKQDKMQWVQNTNQSNVVNLNNVRCESRRQFGSKKEECMESKILYFADRASRYKLFCILLTMHLFTNSC